MNKTAKNTDETATKSKEIFSKETSGMIILIGMVEKNAAEAAEAPTQSLPRAETKATKKESNMSITVAALMSFVK